MMSSQKISDAEHQALLRTAVHVQPSDPHYNFRDKGPNVRGAIHTHTIKKKIHVPVEKDVKVPVVRKQVEHQVQKQVIQATKMVPVKKYRDVKETVLETREEVVHGYREKWVKVREPTTEVIKKQVPVTKTRTVPYIDYVEKRIEHVVDVPKDVVKEKRGYRTDKHVGTKVVEVEEDHHYEMRPVYVKKGDTRMRDAGYINHGKTQHGRSNWGAGDVGFSPRSTSSRALSAPPPGDLGGTGNFAPPPRSRDRRAGERR